MCNSNNFQESLKNLRTVNKFQILFNLLQLLNNQLYQDSSVSFFEKIKGTFKDVKCQLLKMARSGYIVILINLLKGPRTSFQVPTMGQIHVRSVSHTAHQYSTNLFLQYLGFKRNKQKSNFYYVAMHMMTSQILKYVDFTKT